MKNIHILPTDKPSRLIKRKITNELKLSSLNNPQLWNNVNIYITNDEEIKDGDWVIEHSLNWVFKIHKHGLPNYNPNKKKIILTTDQDLINDGVQPIDDEFLEWFVKNPSCDEVKVNPYCEKLTCQNNECKICCQELKYKMIIPKEEPKQETLEDAAENYLLSSIERNQYGDELSFIDGAKWQAERMYSGEEVIDLLSKRSFDLKHKKDSKTSVEWFEQFKKK